MPNYQTMYISKDAKPEEVVEIFGRLLHQLNALMNNFDSKNIRSISTDKTIIKSDDKATELDGSQLIMYDGSGRQRLKLGYNKETKEFEFLLMNKNGANTLKISDTGDAVFKGEIEASKISSSDITASTIDVNSDINVGNNILIGKDSNGTKMIHFFMDNGSFLGQAYISAAKTDITEMIVMAGRIKLNTLDDIIVKRGLGEYKVVTTAMAPYIEIDGVKHFVKWE